MGTNEKDDLIDSHVSSAQCQKAVIALMKHVKKVEKKKEETELLPGKEENVWLVLSVKKLSPEKKLKPFRIPLAHPIIDPRADPICLITKDPQREYKDLLESHNIKFMNRVVGVEKLKGKFRPFEARRMLLKENGLFLADDRVIHLLPKLLGKNFYKAKKQPIPVSLTKIDLKKELEQAVASTYMHQNQGSCSSVKVGTISQSPAHILENLKIALPEIVKRISSGWDNIQSLYIKTSSSVSLPIWLCDRGEGEGDRKEPKEEHMKKTVSSEEINPDKEEADKVETKNGRKRVALEEDRSSSKKAKRAVDSEKKSSNEEATAKSKSASRQAKSLAGMEAEERVRHNGEEKSETKKKRTGITSRSGEVAVVQPSAKGGASSKLKAATPSSVSSDQKSPMGKVTSRGPSTQTNSTLSKEVVKQKKRILQEGSEKKKEKLAKLRLGGSIKENVIGKKSKSRI